MVLKYEMREDPSKRYTDMIFFAVHFKVFSYICHSLVRVSSDQMIQRFQSQPVFTVQTVAPHMWSRKKETGSLLLTNEAL